MTQPHKWTVFELKSIKSFKKNTLLLKKLVFYYFWTNICYQCITVRQRTTCYPFVHSSLLFLHTFFSIFRSCHFFHAGYFSLCACLMLHFISCCTLFLWHLHFFHIAFFSYCIFLIAIFRVALFTCCTVNDVLIPFCTFSCVALFPCYPFFVLYFSRGAIFSIYTFFVFHIFTCCFMLNSVNVVLFSCYIFFILRSFHVALFLCVA